MGEITVERFHWETRERFKNQQEGRSAPIEDPLFPKFRLHTRKLEMETLWWRSEEARLYHRGGCISAGGEEIATAQWPGLASPDNVATQAPSQ